jgi:hypothetical protein
MKRRRIVRNGLIMSAMFILMVCSFIISVSAENITLEPIHTLEDGYVQTNMSTNETTWENNEHLHLHGYEQKLRVVYLKFEVPEFTGTVKNATLNLTINSGVTIPENDTITVHRVLDDTWNSVSKYPTYKDGGYTPHISDTVLATYTFDSTSVVASQVVEIDVKDLIKQPGTYSIALKRSATSGELRFFSSEGTTSGTKKPHLSLEVDPTEARGEISTILRTPPILPGADGYYSLDIKEWVNGTSLYARNGTARIIFIKFDVPQYVKNIKDVKLKLTTNSANAAHENVEVTVYGVKDTNWEEIADLGEGIVAPSGFNTPTVTLNPLDRINAGTPARYTTLTFDLSTLVKGPGTYAFSIRSNHFQALQFYSKEADTTPENKPNIQIDFDIDAEKIIPEGFEVESIISNEWRGINAVSDFNELQDGDKLYRVVKVMNNTDRIRYVTYILAQYNGDELVGVEKGHTLAVDPGWYRTDYSEITYQDGVTAVKSFVWNSLDLMVPQCSTAVID